MRRRTERDKAEERTRKGERGKHKNGIQIAGEMKNSHVVQNKQLLEIPYEKGACVRMGIYRPNIVTL